MAPHTDAKAGVRWRRRPVLSAVIRLVIVLAPVVAAAGIAIALSRALPVPGNSAGTVVWWCLFLATTIATWLICASLLQRLLPLATLLDLTLLFPDAAPSRFGMLRRSANPRQLEGELRRVQETRPDAEPGRRAQVILELAAALSIHDSRTRGHSERVRMFTDLVGQQLRLRQGDADRLRWAALLHDIGKLSVAAEILNKPGRPDDEEWKTLHRHPMEGYRLTAPLHEWLGAWAETVRDHHERFDGTGYPSGLSGEAISLGGRIVAVTDSYETMTAARPYKTPMSVKAARQELVRMSGSHFDPIVVRAFLAISLGRLWRAVGVTAFVAEVPFLAPASWRLSQLGPRSLSAFAAATVTATLLVAGVAGPPGTVNLYRDSSAGLAPAALNPTNSNPPGPAAQPEQPSTPAPSQPGSGTTTPPVSSPGQAVGAPAAGSLPSGAQAATYPAGISRQEALPKGIAKNPSAFAMWRTHH